MLMVFMFAGGEFHGPQDLSCIGIDANCSTGSFLFISTQQENRIPPNYGRAMAGSWERGFPLEILRSPFDRDLRITDTRSIRAPKSRPVFARCDVRATDAAYDPDQLVVHAEDFIV